MPAPLFGIPGDTITAIAIGGPYMKGLNPGLTLFTKKPTSMYALYIIFIARQHHHDPPRHHKDPRCAKLRGPERRASTVTPVIMILPRGVGARATAGNNPPAVW